MFCFLYNWVWQSWYSEINVVFLFLIQRDGSPYLFDHFEHVWVHATSVDSCPHTGLSVLVGSVTLSCFSWWRVSRSNLVRSRVSSLHFVPSLPVLDYWVLGFSSIRWMSLLLLATSESNSHVQFSVGNRWRWSRWHIHFLVFDFFRFHHNCFRDTTSWECIVEDDCVRSCLIELQSFSLSKLYIDPIHRILVHFPLLLVRYKTWFGQTKLFWILVILMHGIHGCKEYRLSVPARILSSRFQSWICDGV